MKTETVSLRLTPELLAMFREVAAREGVSPSSLAAQWIRERLLKDDRKVLLARAMVVVIAALSPDLDHDAAESLVREHFLEAESQ